MKKLLTSLLCIAMVTAFMPTMVWAADGGAIPADSGKTVVTPKADPSEEAAAKVGDTAYKTLQEAVDAAESGQIVLQKDVTEDIVVAAGQTVTIDLNGHKITNSSSHTITNKGTLTVVDSGANKNGTVDNVTHAKAALHNEVGAAATLNGGTFTRSEENGSSAEESGGNSYYAIVNQGTMTINSGVEVVQNGQFSSLLENGWYNGNQNTTKTPSILTINGGTFTGGINTIKNDDWGELTIKDGVFDNSSQATLLNWNVATIAGGTFNSDKWSILNGFGDASMDKGQLTITGGAFSSGSGATVSQMGGSTDAGTITISGGTFTSVESVSLDTNLASGAVTVTGGTFSSDVDSSYIPSGMEATQNEEGKFTVEAKDDAAAKIGSAVYATLNDAIAAVKDGETITLIKDVPNATGIAVAEGKNFTLDFAGHTYTLTGPGEGSTGTETNGFQLLKDSDITFKNGTIRIAENANNIKRIIQNYANLTLEDMHFYAENQVGGEDYALSFNNGNIVFKGDTDIITTSADAIAFDVCNFSNYPSVSVAFDESYTGTINGKIVYDGKSAETAKLTINGNGTFGTIETSASSTDTPSITVSGGTFEENLPEAYLAEGMDTYERANGKFTVAKETPAGELPAIDPTPGYEWVQDENGNYVEQRIPIPPATVQKPIITVDDGAKVDLNALGTTATITVEEGYELVDVTLNGESLGKVTTVTGLKTGDKLIVSVKKKETGESEAEKNARLKKGVQNTTIKLRSTLGKGYIRLNWKKSAGYKVDRYEVFKSTKRYSGYGTKAYFTTKQGGLTGWYKNTKELKKGTRYYYKVRGVRTLGGEKVYTKWSTKAWRLVK